MSLNSENSIVIPVTCRYANEASGPTTKERHVLRPFTVTTVLPMSIANTDTDYRLHGAHLRSLTRC